MIHPPRLRFGVQLILEAGNGGEFHFQGDKLSVDAGCLVIEQDGKIVAAFAPGSWRGAWTLDADGHPPCFAPSELPPASSSSEPELPPDPEFSAFEVAVAAADAPAPVSDQRALLEDWDPDGDAPERVRDPALDSLQAQVSSELSAQRQDAPEPDSAATPLETDVDLHDLLTQLDRHAYVSPAQFSKVTGYSVEALEKGLLALLGAKSIDPARLLDAEIQGKLDLFLPEILRVQKPKKVLEIVEILRSNEETREADVVQLKVWMIRNPKRTLQSP